MLEKDYLCIITHDVQNVKGLSFKVIASFYTLT